MRSFQFLLCFITSGFLSVNGFAQVKERCEALFCFQSVEAGGGIPYYFMNKNYPDHATYSFSYQTGLGLNRYYGSTRISFGMWYLEKNYHTERSSYDEFLHQKNKVQYLSFPVNVSPRIVGNKEYSIALNIGLIFLRPLNLSRETYFPFDSVVIENDLPVDFLLGTSARLGWRFSSKINSSINCFGEVNGEYKFVLEYDYYSPPLGNPAGANAYHNLPNDRLSVNFQIGIEFFFRKRGSSMYPEY